MNLSGITISSTFALGLLHALEPGHGKSFLAAFSLRNTGMKALLVMVGSQFISHFLLISLVALLLQTLLQSPIAENINSSLQWIGPVAVILFGLFLFYRSRNHVETKKGCSCGENHHIEEADLKTASITGILAGMIPCPTSVTPLIIAGLGSQMSHAVTYIFIYILGMSAAMLSFVFLIHLTKNRLASRWEHVQTHYNLNRISASIIILIGVVYLGFQVFGHSH